MCVLLYWSLGSFKVYKQWFCFPVYSHIKYFGEQLDFLLKRYFSQMNINYFCLKLHLNVRQIFCVWFLLLRDCNWDIAHCFLCIPMYYIDAWTGLQQGQFSSEVLVRSAILWHQTLGFLICSFKFICHLPPVDFFIILLLLWSLLMKTLQFPVVC